jgi:glycosyltransferase involved in cell wall biosynthesis
MRIVLHDFGAYPFTAQLARALGERHEVLYLYAGMKQPRARVEHREGDPSNVSYQPVGRRERYRARAGLSRVTQERRYGRALADAIVEARPDVVLSADTPLDAEWHALRAAHRVNSAFVHWIQDIYSLAVGRLLARRSRVIGRLLGARFEALERRIFRASDGLVAIAPDFVPILDRWGVDRDRITVIENWAPLDEVTALPKANGWAERHHLNDVTVFLYAGTLGRKHDPTMLIDLAAAVPDSRVVVVAEGIGADRLRSAQAGRPNLVLLPLQPAAQINLMLASADVLVALLESDAGIFSVPSKVLTYLAAGRPILAAIPSTNLAAKTIVASQAGVVIDPGDRAGFVSAAQRLASDPSTRVAAANAGLAYASRKFDVADKARTFEAVLHEAIRWSQSSNGNSIDTAGAR